MENKVPPNQLREISGILAAADDDTPIPTSGGQVDEGENRLYQLEEDDYKPDLNNSYDQEEVIEEEEQEEQDDGIVHDDESEGVPDTGAPEEQSDITTITELAEEFDVEPEVLYNLHVPLRDGEEPVTISRLKDIYQEYMRAGAPESIQGVQEELNSLRAELARTTSERPVQHEALTQVDTDLAALKQQYDNVDWARFESEQPAEAVLQKQKFQEAFANLQGKREQIANGLAQQEAQATQQYQMGQWNQARQMISGWNNEETMHQELGEMSKMLQGYGFQTEEIRQIVDARLLHFINDAMKTKAKLDKPLPRKRAPRGGKGRLRAGSLRGKPDASSKRDALIKRGQKEKNPRAKAQVITDLIKQGG